jgi:hypothetical protein
MLAIGEVFPSSLNVYLPLLSLCCLSDSFLKEFKLQDLSLHTLFSDF